MRYISSSSSSDGIEQNFENKSPEVGQNDNSDNENPVLKMEISNQQYNDQGLIEKTLTNKEYTHYYENDKDTVSKHIETLKMSCSKSKNELNKENKQTTSLKKHKAFKKNIIVDESSQESLATPQALRFWRMKIKLNTNEHDKINNDSSQEKKIIQIESDSDSISKY